MLGTILGLDHSRNCWLISGDDGNRYSFAKNDGPFNGDPVEGDRVDFEADGDTAKAVFLKVNIASKIFRREIAFRWKWLFFSLNGRVGRVAYFVRGIIPLCILYGIASYFIAKSNAGSYGWSPSGSFEQNELFFQLHIGMAFLIFWPFIALAIKRSHDISCSAYYVVFAVLVSSADAVFFYLSNGVGFVLSLLISGIYNTIFFLVLLFKAGTQGDNTFGPPPA